MFLMDNILLISLHFFYLIAQYFYFYHRSEASVSILTTGTALGVFFALFDFDFDVTYLAKCVLPQP